MYDIIMITNSRDFQILHIRNLIMYYFLELDKNETIKTVDLIRIRDEISFLQVI